MVPIVFHQYGKRAYVEYAIKCALEHENRVVLIGDENQDKTLCEFCSLDAVWVLAKEFESHYKHVSKLPKWFELFCFQRWFSLLEWMGLNDVDSVLAVDSDVLIFCNADEEAKKLPKCDFTLSENYDGICTAGQCFILNPDALSDFCGFCTKSFDAGKPLGNDMSAWTEFRKSTNLRCHTTQEPINGEVFDHQMCYHLDQYESVNGMKRIQFIDGVPYCKNIKTGEFVRFKLLHCWEYAEVLMPQLFERKSL